MQDIFNTIANATKPSTAMNTLPKYFVIKWTNNPLWEEYIDWLNETYNDELVGEQRNDYYGTFEDIDGQIISYHTPCLDSITPVITLQQWKQAISTPEPVKSNDMHTYMKVKLFPNSNKLAEDLALMACMSNSGLNLSLDALNNHAAEHLNGSSCTVNGNILVLNQGERTVLIIEEREEFVMPETKDY